MLLELNFTLILFAASFLVFIYFLNLTLFKPVGKVIEKRKELIEGEHLQAKDLRDEANKLLDNYTKQIKLARQESQGLIQESINQTQKIKQEKINVITTELSKEKEEALKQIKKEQEIALKQLEAQINLLKDLITNKVLGTGEKTLVLH